MRTVYQWTVADGFFTNLHQSFRFLSAVSDNTRPVMSKTSLDFGFSYDFNQKSEESTLSRLHILADLCSKQKVIVCDHDLPLVDFDPAFCVFRGSLFLNLFSVRVACF